jgi:hypothetical protein
MVLDGRQARAAIPLTALQVCLDALEICMDLGQETSQAREVIRQQLHERSLLLVRSFSLDR